MRFLKALKQEPVDRPPIWFMRQAGRYLPEYRNLRTKTKKFIDFCKNQDLVIEATLQPFARYPLDAAIIFSDILVIPNAMGMELDFVENKGPVFASPLQSIADLKKLNINSVSEELLYVYSSIAATKQELKVPLIGFAGSPWTVGVYMLEGKGKNNFPNTQKMIYENRNFVNNLLDTLTPLVANHLISQAKAGADAVMIFDSWAGILPPHLYKELSLASITQVVRMFKLECPNVPIIVFSKGAGNMLAEQASIGCDALGIDQYTSLIAARDAVKKKVALQGNLNPYALYAPTDTLIDEVNIVLDAFKGEPGQIFNLGHGIMPDVDPDAISIVCDTVLSYTKEA
ncbi:MAG: uroporphyrinogen decarboxylase [Francisellaceae bacterium]|jgi:uroporphyrinogen decarboxylase|nr:uroporphyrinogen decarboxylase [Francisellaceae bacterium]MBT6207650.1 uroporphyrinogen decarboxylase [Francisellaceae bacterium]MBT6538439.1 uroporphyrinogen decarboxylase [Francisellaceae bacterium]